MTALLKIVIAAMLFLITGLTACGQAATSTGPERDADALQLLSRALELSGGAGAWKSIHGAELTGTLTRVTHGQTGLVQLTSAISWTDDWSTGRPRYKRSITVNGITHVLRHPDNPGSTATIQGKSVKIPQFDITTVLLTHLPAAAIESILVDSRYVVRMGSASSTNSDDIVEVVNPYGICKERWLISRQSGNVHAVQFTVPDAMNNHHEIWEVASYQRYRVDAGLSHPDEVTIREPTGQVLHLAFGALISNPDVTESEFTQGVSQ